MKTLLTIARGIRRMFPALVRPVPRDPDSEIVEEFALAIPSGGMLRVQMTAAMQEAMSEELRAAAASPMPAPPAWQLEIFGRTLSRYSRKELMQLRAGIGVPGASAVVGRELAAHDAQVAAALTRFAEANEFADMRAEADATVANLSARLLALVPQILHRASLRVLRPVTPRAPAVACLA